MSYLILLEVGRRDLSRLAITDSYSVHRLIYNLFDDVRSEGEKQQSIPANFCYADLGGNTLRRQFLVLSDRLPRAQEWQDSSISVKKVEDRYLEEKAYRFKIIINPTTRDSATQALKPVKGREAIADWFLQRAEKNWGFRPNPETLIVDKVEVQVFTAKNNRRITLAQAHLSGTFEVTDRTLFIKAFKAGIGRGRAFGCGLLQIVPVK
ncbi:MAG: type I-E CRISPR-associated protein Cas6/Cse3/CasE [Oxalobacter sp.]